MLLVEDDVDVREAVEQILTLEGFQVVAAPDGGVALQVLAEGHHRFCTVILDVLMPGVDGAEFLARAREQLRTIPVLLFSPGAACPATCGTTLRSRTSSRSRWRWRSAGEDRAHCG